MGRKASCRAAPNHLGPISRSAAPVHGCRPPPPSAMALTDLIRGIRDLLGRLQRAGYCKGANVDDSDVDDVLWAQRSSLSDTRLTVTLTESASLRAAIVLNGRANASPELVRPLLLAYLRANGITTQESAEYFLDDEYRSNPLDYRPNQQVLTFTMRPSGL